MAQVRDSIIDFLSQALVFDTQLLSSDLELALDLSLFSCSTLAQNRVSGSFKSLTFVLVSAAFEQHQNAVELQLGIWLRLLSSITPIAFSSSASSVLLDSIVSQT